jgi:ABC-2 type transport system ATP-binding protein
MSDYAVQFENVVKDYPTDILGRKKLRAVNGVNLNIEPGQVFGLIGPNRAGKTTLVKILLSLCRATQGTTRRLGRPVSERRTLARVGYMHENQAFPRYLTAAALLEYYGALTLLPEPEVRRRAPQLLERVGLADRSREPIARFSKGMVQRLGLAQALLNEPELLVLDEPAEGLDLLGRKLLREVIADQRRGGRTVLLVSHVLEEVAQLCDRLGVIAGGRLVFVGPTADLLVDSKTGQGRSLETALEGLYQKNVS